MADEEVVIIGGARTPMADYVGAPGGGRLKDISAIELDAMATKDPSCFWEGKHGYGGNASAMVDEAAAIIISS